MIEDTTLEDVRELTASARAVMEKPHKPKLQPFLDSGEIVESEAIDGLGLTPISPHHAEA